MPSRGKYIFAVLFMCVAWGSVRVPAFASGPEAGRGTIDLSSWSFERDGKVKLSGEWEFHWNALLGPGEIPAAGKAVFMRVPGFWNTLAPGGGKAGGNGCATYRLTVKIPDIDREYALEIPYLYTAYRLWVDDRLLAENGTVGTNTESSVPYFFHRMAVFRPQHKDLRITVQVSNFHHFHGGFWSPISLDTAPRLIESNRRAYFFDMMAFGGLILMGFYHLALFFFRRKDQTSLYFGLFCLVTAFRIVIEGNRLLLGIVPSINWQLNEFFSYMTFFLIQVTGVLYVQRILPDEFPARAARISTGIGLAFTGVILAIPARFYYYLLVPFSINAAFWVLVCAWAIVMAAVRKREGIHFLIAGFLVFTATGVNDMLYYAHLSPVGNIVHFGLLAFVFCQSVIIAMRFSHAYNRAETLSVEKTRLFADAIEIVSSLILESSMQLYEFTRNATKIAVLIAKRTGMPEDEVEEVRIAALLHDLGMISVNRKLAVCMSGCEEDEKMILENHPLKSNEIIRKLSELTRVMMIISQHHERYDGSGYPLKLKKNEIHPGARIIGLADDFVTMLSMREYQTVEKKEKIKKALLKMRGTAHDPALVDALVEIIETEKLIYDIREEDVKVRSEGDAVVWEIPSNKYFETLVVDKVITEIVSRAGIDRDTAFSIDFSLCEVIRNAIIHGNKYDEKKSVTITLRVEDADSRKRIIITVRDEGEGMDLREYNRYSESSEKLRQISGRMRQFMESAGDQAARDEISALIGLINDFRAKYYIDFNTYRQIDSTESTGGVGLIHVLKTFDRVDYRNIVVNYAIKGLEVVMEKLV